jgi:CRISPR-associated protein (TIGR03984 family)
MSRATNDSDSKSPPTQRTIERCEASVQVDVVSEPPGSEEALRDWLEQTADEQGTRWLKGYDDDGVLWGRFDAGGTLTTAREVVRQSKGEQAADRFAQLRPVTLQEVYLFGREREVKLWRDDTGEWRVRYIRDPASGREPAPEEDEHDTHDRYFDEDHLLIGTYGERIGQAFTLLWEGRNQRRHLHAVPAALSLSGDPARVDERPRLRVRTYLTDGPWREPKRQTDGPWYEPSRQRHVGLVDREGNDLNAPEGPAASSHS